MGALATKGPFGRDATATKNATASVSHDRLLLLDIYPRDRGRWPRASDHTRMKEYLIFHYAIDGVEYVEAYPTRNADAMSFLLGRVLTCDADLVHEWAWVATRSRTQARRAAWSNWLSHIPWDDVPYRAYVDMLFIPSIKFLFCHDR